MASDGDRPHSKSGRPYWPVTPYGDIQIQIGRALRSQYDLPQELPSRLLTLLLQLTERENE
jgi:hypothetical protein